MNYQVIGHSSRVGKDFYKALDKLSDEQRQDIEKTLTENPKGTASSHWTIKKVKKNIWQCDLPDGWRISYCVLDKPVKQVVVLFADNHDDEAKFLRRIR